MEGKYNTNYIILRVEDIDPKDIGRGIVRISPEYMEHLKIDVGDIVRIKGEGITCGRVIMLPMEQRERPIIQMDEMTMGNAGTARGKEVELSFAEVKTAASISIAMDEYYSGYSKNPNGDYIKKMMKNHCLCTGDRFSVKYLGSVTFDFRVIETFPAGYVRIDDTTRIFIKESIGESGNHTTIGYKDIGGLDQQITRIKEMIEYPIRYPELFSKLNLQIPSGILLYGPPGTGKTLIAKAIANEVSTKFITINGPEIVNKYYGESEAKLREIFEEAGKNSPSIIFIDELDSIAPKREEVQGDVEKRIVAQLLSLMDGVKDRSGVTVIGATNLPNSLDPALRRPGRFDKEIYVGVPAENARLEILKIHTRHLPLASDVDLQFFAQKTHGYVGADLSALCKEASMNCARRYLNEQAFSDEKLRGNGIQVSLQDFMVAMGEVYPSAIREVRVEVPHITWDRIGGLSSIKARLKEIVEWPLRYPFLFSAMNMKQPKGILLYGPPGTGKTLVAQAIATECGANFISVKGPELLSKWQGETEKGIREIFKNAKQTAPCIIFFDEIDSFTGRSEHGYEKQPTILGQFLTELDGIEALEGVMIVGATNRIDAIDQALLRDGRFDLFMQFELPEFEERKEIFSIHLADKPVSPDVDLDKLAEFTSGFNGAEIGGVCKRAAFLAIRNYLHHHGEECKDMDTLKITQEDLEVALNNRIEGNQVQ